jgi:hypothetical protein
MDRTVFDRMQRPSKQAKHTTTMSIGQKRQREEAPQPQQEAQPYPRQQAPAPKNKTCQCGSKVSDAEVRLSSWTLGTGLRVQQCSNCS